MGRRRKRKKGEERGKESPDPLDTRACANLRSDSDEDPAANQDFLSSCDGHWQERYDRATRKEKITSGRWRWTPRARRGKAQSDSSWSAPIACRSKRTRCARRRGPQEVERRVTPARAATWNTLRGNCERLSPGRSEESTVESVPNTKQVSERARYKTLDSSVCRTLVRSAISFKKRKEAD